jgi:hypothetical protein
VNNADPGGRVVAEDEMQGLSCTATRIPRAVGIIGHQGRKQSGQGVL